MKKIIKMAFAVVALAAVGLGSYKAYGSYTATNMSKEDLLWAENIEALAQSPNETSGSKKKHKVLRVKDSGSCWKSEWTNSRAKRDGLGRIIGTEYYYVSRTTGSTWCKCKKVTAENDEDTDNCTKHNCPDGQSTCKQAEGWF